MLSRTPQAHPERVLGIVAVAVTTTDRFQVDWTTETVGAVYPEAWDRLARHAERASKLGVGLATPTMDTLDLYFRLDTPEANPLEPLIQPDPRGDRHVRPVR